MKKRAFTICLCLVLIMACAAPNGSGKSEPHGFGKAVLGVAQLVLSPFQIAAGLLEGIASVPYYLSMSLQDINQGMVAADAKVTLDDTYESAYGKRIKAVSPDGDTGEVFRRMKHATEYFQKVLRRYGLKDADHYILTSIDTATGKGYTLFAVVYRPRDTIRVIDKYDGTTIRTFTKEDRLYYEPFEKNASGGKLDMIVDWSGLSREFIANQKGQALMLTMAANAVVNEKKSPDYWAIEKRWIAGDYEEIVQTKMNSVKNKMKIEN
ncbi:MAG: hypothetical protein JW943_03550 [Deltaproteobacteria bacterium]|nr:hypothetical protein [Deltaproteobacteria bacterium]